MKANTMHDMKALLTQAATDPKIALVNSKLFGFYFCVNAAEQGLIRGTSKGLWAITGKGLALLETL